MKYITHKRFKSLALCGERLNLSYGTELLADGDILTTLDGKAVCSCKSENAKLYFARNDDGHGLDRGRLTAAIIKTLASHPSCWDKIWVDAVCRKYKRTDHADTWLWDHDFYNADMNDLRYIAGLIGGKLL